MDSGDLLHLYPEQNIITKSLELHLHSVVTARKALDFPVPSGMKDKYCNAEKEVSLSHFLKLMSL